MNIPSEIVAKVVAFHGHHCPGLSIGIRAGMWARETFGTAYDEEIVLLTETDMCGVDALQVLLGTTFGKGNLVFHDYGKVAFSIYRRRDGKKVRLIYRTHPADKNLTREQRVEKIMTAAFDDLFIVGEPLEEVPPLARIHQSLPCRMCGENVMATRLVEGLCIPCSQKIHDQH
ncbi:MAG: FmdE family protein [Planctomycetia bacterium]|nr:FmdE family protein [Planctomycetia bacterium]